MPSVRLWKDPYAYFYPPLHFLTPPDIKDAGSVRKCNEWCKEVYGSVRERNERAVLRFESGKLCKFALELVPIGMYLNDTLHGQGAIPGKSI